MNDTALAAHLEQSLPAALDLLEQMVAINTFTANAEGVNRLGRLTAEAFAPLGFAAEFVPSAHPAYGQHLLLSRPGRQPRSLMCVSHLDTVFPPEEEARHQFRWQREGHRIYGPGTVDIKGGTALLWLILRTLREHETELFENLGWQLFLNSSEEMLSDDFGVLCRQRAAPGTLACLVFEGEGREHGRPRLVVARKGRATWRVRITGRGAHAGNRLAEGANAILQLGSTLQQVAAFTDPARGLTFNPGMVRGGSVLNRVPHEAVAEGELRAFDPVVFADAKSRLLALAGPGEVRSASDGYRCQVAVDILTESRPWPRNPATDRLFQIWQQAGAEIGVPVDAEERGGLSDGNHVWDCMPTLDGLGPYGGNDHCSERSADGSKLPEYVDVTSFVPKARVNIQAIKRLAATP